ncbi:thiamine phosphate synthase [Vibrio neptunius]|uniref:Thiamine-phosphate synthase n=1 Tax=Vibrio neptunius TaxID=170651 RepID=A0ABS3A6V7_9VIBR|nr:thiamine phosphate synthase [Vibrio neptunius]MBN3494260.1 thiamine phosphate synthase [Vibrio neptunius]MBN3516664.1 thiamine phosphate synthase [Vibrio neptunius]MBN3550849.1 thiamine phosphate synthase [Vibrio neptunius]MBN3578978.1 thiamine phosphate synthase [Vibrio neptunius]MCH9872642.1 thiamine phosphate synthase [Vibrio neptunius]
MAKILIPTALADVKPEIEQCLQLAKEKGFEIQNIELGVSPAQTVQISHGSEWTKLATDLVESVVVGHEYTYFIEYCSGITIKPSRSIIASSHAYIDVLDVNQVLDIWLDPSRDQVCALASSVNQSEFDRKRHFAWVVTLISLAFTLEDALTLARAMVNVSRETWAENIIDFPSPVLEDYRLGISAGWIKSGNQLAFPSVSKCDLGLYPVVDSVEWVKKLLGSGVKTVQLRIKDPLANDLEQQVKDAVALGRRHDAQVFINDHWRLAIKHQAYGVHLGQEDIEESNLAELAKANLRLGLSTHGYYELLRVAQTNPTYLALGHIFPTQTKQIATNPQGLVKLALYQKLVNTMPYINSTGIPTVAIGGITQSNARSVWNCGVTSLALVSAITNAPSLEHAIEFFTQLTAEERRNISVDVWKEVSAC